MSDFKPLLKYKGKSFIINILSKLNNVCNKIVVVTGYKNDEVETEIKNYFKDNTEILEKLILIHNSNYKNGMFFSLQIGLNKMTDSDWIIYHFVDQPHLPSRFYSEFTKEIDIDYQWIQPQYKARKGHPILIHNSIFSKILDTKRTSLKDISQSSAIRRKIWNCDYPHVVKDIDTNEDYQKLT